MQIAPTMNRMRRQRVKAELEAVARAITRSSFADQACQRMGFGHRRHGLVVDHSADLTGWGCARQSPGVVMPDEWIDVSFRSDVDAAELLGLLADPFVQGGWEDEGTIHLYWPQPQLVHGCITFDFGQILATDSREGRLSGADVLVQSLPHQDWNQQWAQSVKPTSVGRRIVIQA